MRDFNYSYLSAAARDDDILSVVGEIRGYRAAQDGLIGRDRATASALAASARVESAESSDRLEGVTASPDRIEKLCAGAAPETPGEEEIAGYIDALSLILSDPDGTDVTPQNILNLHEIMYRPTKKGIGGKYKSGQNLIAEKGPDGEVRTVFVPTDPYETPVALGEACKSLNAALGKGDTDPLLIVPAFIYDFLCIHPFEDGNGRMSRLLTTLLLSRNGYVVGKYVSLERIMENSRQTYYEALDAGNSGWDDNTENIVPFIRYTLGTVLSAYRELESAAGGADGTGSAYDAVKTAVAGMTGMFTREGLARRVPGLSRSSVLSSLKRLESERKVEVSGTGKSTRYRRIDD